MNDLLRERVESLTRHIATSGGGAGFGVGFVPMENAAAGPIVLGLHLSQWFSLAVAIAGAVNAWVSKQPARE